MTFNDQFTYNVPDTGTAYIRSATIGEPIPPHQLDQILATTNSIEACGMIRMTSNDVAGLYDADATSVTSGPVAYRCFKHPIANFYVFMKFTQYGAAHVATSSPSGINLHGDLIVLFYVSKVPILNEELFFCTHRRVSTYNMLPYEIKNGLRTCLSFMDEKSFWFTTSPYTRTNSTISLSDSAAGGTNGNSIFYKQYESNFCSIFVSDLGGGDLFIYLGFVKQSSDANGGGWSLVSPTSYYSNTDSSRWLCRSRDIAMNLNVDILQYSPFIYTLNADSAFKGLNSSDLTIYNISGNYAGEMNVFLNGSLKRTGLLFINSDVVQMSFSHEVNGKQYVSLESFGILRGYTSPKSNHAGGMLSSPVGNLIALFPI